MSFTVIWTPAAEDELTELWLAAGDRGRVADAARSVDRRLQSNPSNEGESRFGDLRVLFDAPLGVLFKVAAAAQRVTVVHVWRYRTV